MLSINGDSEVLNRTSIYANANDARINLVTASIERQLVYDGAADLVRETWCPMATIMPLYAPRPSSLTRIGTETPPSRAYIADTPAVVCLMHDCTRTRALHLCQPVCMALLEPGVLHGDCPAREA